MPRIALNPLTMEEMQFAKMSNMQMDKVEGMEELIDGVNDNELKRPPCARIMKMH